MPKYYVCAVLFLPFSPCLGCVGYVFQQAVRSFDLSFKQIINSAATPKISMLSDHSTIEAIKLTRRRITILFSDIEESTRHWERRGDVDARMLIERHNCLLFPVIRKFRGRIIKTLGDAIMAAFDKPDNAVKAAIAMQQILAREREQDKYFSLRTRIGIHTGTGLVEDEDIFGDVVNIAAKVQAEADANQILLTSSAVAHLENKICTLNEHSSLKPKGKRKPVSVLDCNWRDHVSLISHIKPDTLLPLMKRHRFELLIYVVVGLCALFFLYYHYLRYLLVDYGVDLNRFGSSLHLPADTTPLLMLLALIILAFIIYVLRIHFISRALLRSINGLFGFGLVLLGFHFSNDTIQPGFNQHWYGILYQSRNTFIEVVADRAPLHTRPDSQSDVRLYLTAGDFFIFNKNTEADERLWHQVILSGEEAWLPQRIPPAFGVAEKQLCVTRPFVFHKYDLYALILAMIGFVRGYLHFKMKLN